MFKELPNYTFFIAILALTPILVILFIKSQKEHTGYSTQCSCGATTKHWHINDNGFVWKEPVFVNSK